MGNYHKRGLATIIIIGTVCVICAVAAIVSDKYLGPDNPIENSAEAVIKAETGVEIDFTPENK